MLLKNLEIKVTYKQILLILLILLSLYFLGTIFYQTYVEYISLKKEILESKKMIHDLVLQLETVKTTINTNNIKPSLVGVGLTTDLSPTHSSTSIGVEKYSTSHLILYGAIVIVAIISLVYFYSYLLSFGSVYSYMPLWLFKLIKPVKIYSYTEEISQAIIKVEIVERTNDINVFVKFADSNDFISLSELITLYSKASAFQAYSNDQIAIMALENQEMLKNLIDGSSQLF